MAVLYQFPFSHFCEKARWALDYKRQAYSVRNLLPGPHLKVTRKLAGKSSVPILVDAGTTVQDSAAIIDYLDARHSVNPLTPGVPALESEAREWEKYLDSEVGIALRTWFYYHTLPNRKSAMTFLLHDAPWYGGALYAIAFPKIRAAMIAYMKINAESAKQSEDRLVAALSKIGENISGTGFLVGEEFSRADLTACALLSPIVSPIDKLKRVYPEAVLSFRDRYSDQPVFKWVNEMYRDYRYTAGQ